MDDKYQLNRAKSGRKYDEDEEEENLSFIVEDDEVDPNV